MKLKRYIVFSLCGIFLAGCNSNGSMPNQPVTFSGTIAGGLFPAPWGDNSPNSPISVKPERKYETDVLLFVGPGTWGAEISSIENILGAHNTTYREVDSDELDRMSVDDIAKYGLLIFPGGLGGTQASSLSSQTRANLREAVQQKGVSYVGICAGAFIAVAPAPEKGMDVSYGLGVVDGPVLDYYYLEEQGTEWAMTPHKLANGATLDVLWYGGPITPNVPGGVIAKYPDGNPAISQMWSGNGFVILSGGHPTATSDILQSFGFGGNTRAALDFTWRMFEAALHQQPMGAF